MGRERWAEVIRCGFHSQQPSPGVHFSLFIVKISHAYFKKKKIERSEKHRSKETFTQYFIPWRQY
jgi:hypothetical protein